MRYYYRYAVFISIALALLANQVAGSSCGTIPAGLVPVTGYCIPVSIGSASSSSGAAAFFSFNAANYSSYLAGNLMNVYVYNSISGYTVNSWIEGNMLNEYQNTNLNTASNVLIWFIDPAANVINTANDINYYVGIGTTTSTDFFSNALARIGAAPQLSPTYAGYDDGANVFIMYQNFAGSSCPSGWSCSGTGVSINNGASIPFTSGSEGKVLTSAAYSANGLQVADVLGNIMGGGAIANGNGFLGYGSEAAGVMAGFYSDSGAQYVDGVYGSAGALAEPYATAKAVFSINYYSSTAGLFNLNYGAGDVVTGGSSVGTRAFGVDTWSAAAPSFFMQWARFRQEPPGNVMPASSVGVIVMVSGLTATISPSAAQFIVGGQSVGFTSTVMGGTPGYAYQWLSSPAPGTCSSFSNIGGAASATYTAAPTSNTYYCLKATDSVASVAYSPVTNVVVSNYQVQGITYNATEYETANSPYIYSITLSSAYTSANVEITISGPAGLIAAQWSNTLVSGPQPQTFPFYYGIQLQPVNNIQFTVNAFLFYNGVTSEGEVNTINQAVLQNYFPGTVTKYNPILIGSAETIFMNVSQVKNLHAATVNSMLVINANSFAWGSILLYKYYYQSSSFIPNSIGIQNPYGENDVVISYSAPVNLSYDGNFLWRNQTSSFTVNSPLLIACGAGNAGAVNTFAWNFFNATSLAALTENAFVTGFFTIKNGLWSSNAIPGTTAGLPSGSPGTSNAYETCIYPPWASFKTVGTFGYGATNYSASQFLLVNQSTSNTPDLFNLYLPQLTNPSSYDIVVENGVNNPISAYVAVLLYNTNLNESIQVNFFQTPNGAGTVTNLQTGSYYYFKVYDANGQLLNTTGPLQAECASGSTCVYYIQLANTTPAIPSQYLSNLVLNCAYTQNNALEVGTVSCAVGSVNGASIAGNLTIYQSNVFQNIAVCTTSATAANFNLVCDGTQINNHTYVWQLRVYDSQSGELLPDQGQFGSNASLFGGLGFLIALVIVAVFGMIFIFVSPMVSVILAVAGLILTGLVNLVTLDVNSLGFIIVFGAIIIFALSRRN